MAATVFIPSKTGLIWISGSSTGPRTPSTLPRILPPEILILVPNRGGRPSNDTKSPPS